jgi:hypothetical protein
MADVGQPRESPRFQRDDSTPWRRTIDGVVLLPPNATDPLRLEGGAASIWELLVTPLTVAEVVRELAGTYRVDGSVIIDEVDRTMRALEVAGALCHC